MIIAGMLLIIAFSHSRRKAEHRVEMCIVSVGSGRAVRPRGYGEQGGLDFLGLIRDRYILVVPIVAAYR